jgi:hypothetical protein
MKELLIELEACSEAREWAADKTWKEIYTTCHRGDWLLWLFKKTNPDDLQLLTLTKGHCVNTVRHLMKDERSIKAIDIAIAFGEGKATREELDTAAAAAYANYPAYAAAATYAAYAAAADDAVVAANSAAASAAYAADDAVVAANSAAASAAYAAYAAVKKHNQQLTADICRKYLPIEMWNIS